MLRLDSDVQYVKGVGPRRSTLLASRGIRTVQDLLLRINNVPDPSVPVGSTAAPSRPPPCG